MENLPQDDAGLSEDIRNKISMMETGEASFNKVQMENRLKYLSGNLEGVDAKGWLEFKKLVVEEGVNDEGQQAIAYAIQTLQAVMQVSDKVGTIRRAATNHMRELAIANKALSRSRKTSSLKITSAISHLFEIAATFASKDDVKEAAIIGGGMTQDEVNEAKKRGGTLNIS